MSAFQSDRFGLFSYVFERIFISGACNAELERHGWEDEVRAAYPKLVVLAPSPDEEQKSLTIAQQIASDPETTDRNPKNHLGEAQVIVLAQRQEFRDDLILLDEAAARTVARQLNQNLSGFAGVLLLAVQANLISPDNLRQRLEKCRSAGTHYSPRFIEQVYRTAKQERGTK